MLWDLDEIRPVFEPKDKKTIEEILLNYQGYRNIKDRDRSHYRVNINTSVMF